MMVSVVFDRVKDELTTNKDKYQEEIIRMQNCIKKITEQSMNMLKNSVTKLY